MESKVFKFGDSEFTLIDNNLLLGQKSNKLLKKYFTLQEEYTGDIDQSLIEQYESRIEELEIALEQAEDKAELQLKLDTVKEELQSDLKAQSILRLKKKCEGLILKDLTEDTEFMQPLFKEILIGDHSKLDYSDPGITIFITEVITDFFYYTTNRKKKLQSS